MIVYVILAAGDARRMGFAKVTTPLAGESPIERLGAILKGRIAALVTTHALKAACARALPAAQLYVNENARDGMNSSLLIANRAIDPGATLGVMLADKPFVRADTLDRCELALVAAPGCDVAFPVSGGEPGHPVYFAPAARVRLNALPAGDTLRAVRDDPRLSRIAVECDDSGIVIDLDTPEAWRSAERRLRHA